MIDVIVIFIFSTVYLTGACSDIGGYTYYGLIDKAEIIKEDNLLPIGLAKGARLIRSVSINNPITLNDVEIDRNSVLWKLRKLYNEMI